MDSSRSRHRRVIACEPLEGRWLLSTLATETEPNNDRAGATRVSWQHRSTALELLGAVSKADHDYYRVDLGSASSGRAQVTLATGSGRVLDITVRSASGRVIAHQANARTGSSFTFAAKGSARYFVEVGSRGSSVTAYDLRLEGVRNRAARATGAVSSDPAGTLTTVNGVISTSLRPGQTRLIRGLSSNFSPVEFRLRPLAGGWVTLENLDASESITVLVTPQEDAEQLNPISIAPGETVRLSVFRGTSYRFRLNTDSDTVSNYLVRTRLLGFRAGAGTVQIV